MESVAALQSELRPAQKFRMGSHAITASFSQPRATERFFVFYKIPAGSRIQVLQDHRIGSILQTSNRAVGR